MKPLLDPPVEAAAAAAAAAALWMRTCQPGAKGGRGWPPPQWPLRRRRSKPALRFAPPSEAFVLLPELPQRHQLRWMEVWYARKRLQAMC
jgi:hypothetical protein